MKRKNEGITLVALVITVIVLIILAGVTISMVVDDNGIITKAKEAKQNMTNASAEEEELLQNLLNEIKGVDGGEEIEIPENPTIETTLKEGDYVWYEDANGVKQKCMVLYGPENEKYSSYGIQIITAKTTDSTGIVGNVTLGVQDDFNASRDSYNNAIETLNIEAEKYRKKDDGIAKLARCVGSIPDNPNYDEAGMFTMQQEDNINGYFTSYNGTFKNADKNYEEDCNQMKLLGIDNIGVYYCLASRYIKVDRINYNIRFGMHFIDENGENNIIKISSRAPEPSLFNKGDIILVDYMSSSKRDIEYGFRPVFNLKPGIKVTSGDGKENNPYTLEP